MEPFSSLAVRQIPAIERYGIRKEFEGDTDKFEIYTGPNIRAFMADSKLNPNDWRSLLDYNQIGSALDLVAGQTQLAIPGSLLR